MAKPFTIFAAVAALACVVPEFVFAQADALSRRLEMERLGGIESGAYVAGDKLHFTLNAANGYYLLRFENSPEVFVLYAGPGSLGGRLLRYDSGETAMRVAGWGGITLYTDAQPGGLPAVRTGDSVSPALPNVSLSDIQNAADDESEHLAYVRNIHGTFKADFEAMAGGANLRALSFDTMENTARGIERFTASREARQLFADHVEVVRVTTTGSRPTIRIAGKELTVTFNPARGYAGRASSRAIARALKNVFARKED